MSHRPFAMSPTTTSLLHSHPPFASSFFNTENGSRRRTIRVIHLHDYCFAKCPQENSIDGRLNPVDMRFRFIKYFYMIIFLWFLQVQKPTISQTGKFGVMAQPNKIDKMFRCRKGTILQLRNLMTIFTVSPKFQISTNFSYDIGFWWFKHRWKDLEDI